MKLSMIIEDYINSHRQNSQKELDCFKNQPSLEKAIKYAALAMDSEGKRYSHQRRIKPGAIEKAKSSLSSSVEGFRKCKNFEQLLNIVKTKVGNIYGIGELYVYDTALRIGAKLDLLPQRVYLHAGTLQGANALGLNTKRRAVEVNELPYGLQQILPLEVEDVLCIYKNELK